jgi:nucleoid-associated protein YgaU/DNA-binding SARP family transcriptional activator
MRQRRAASVLRGLGSVLLVTLLVGPPVALAVLVGWPLPTSVPDIGALDRAARTGISDEVVVNVLAAIAWLAWAQVALALLAEIVAVLRGRPAARLPVLPGVQAAAAHLVASVAFVAGSFHTAQAAAGPGPLPVNAPVVDARPVAEVISTVVAEPPPVAAANAKATQPVPTITVQRHETYWEIAERCLGDGLRWREIRDLNIGRTMTDGYVVTPTSDLLRPGWVLNLPADARTGTTDAVARAGDASSEAPTRRAGAAEVIVKPGDNLWVVAERQLAAARGSDPGDAEIRPYWQQVIEANRDRLVSPGNPDLILPGQPLTMPATHDPAPVPSGPPAVVPDETTRDVPPVATAPPTNADAPTSTAPTTPPDSRSTPGPTSPVEAEPVEAEDTTSKAPIIAIGGIASAALAVGAIRAVRLRRRRLALARPAQRPRPTDDDQQELHRQLVANADEATIDDLVATLGRLAVDLAESGASCRPRIVQHAPDHLDLFLDMPTGSAPDGWKVEGDGALWTLIADTTSDAPDEPVCAAPLLVTLGKPDDSGQLYLDLEAEGVVALTGAPDVARNVARRMIAELALTPLADSLHVFVLGDTVDPAVARLDHVTVKQGWDDIADDVTAWAAQSHAALTNRRWPNTFVARGADPGHDALAPVVVVASEPPPPELLEDLRSQMPAALAIVVIGQVDGPVTVLDCESHQLNLVDIGLACTPDPMEPDALESIVKLLDTTERPGSEQLTLPTEPSEEDDADVDCAAPPEPEFEVLVRLLGDIRVEGGESLLPKQTAVVVYIALHAPVTAERLEDAVWAGPSSTSRRKRLANTLSDCRAALGRRLLPAATDGRYALGAEVVTDTELFDLRVKRAAGQPPEHAAETLRSALDLVTGRLFSYRNAARHSYAWVDVENWQSTWDLKVAAVAQHCAETYLDLGRHRDAVAIALHALDAVPVHTGLTETLMRAHAADGDRVAVQRVYQAHVAALHQLGLDDPEPSTTDLLDELCQARAG